MSEELESNIVEETKVEEVKTEETKVDKLDVLGKFDFSTTEEFDLNGYYESVTDLKLKRETLKQFEAENILKQIGPKYVDAQTITEFDDKKENLRNLMRRFGADKEELQKMSNDAGGERDKLYAVSNYLYNTFVSSLSDIKYHITFTWKEFDFIVKTLHNKLEYGADEVFQLKKFMIEFLDNAIVDFKRVGTDESFRVQMNLSNMVLLYHLISKYKVHGVNKQFDEYLNILDKIGEANQVYNALNIIKERLNTEFQMWTTSITPDQIVVGTKAEEVK